MAKHRINLYLQRKTCCEQEQRKQENTKKSSYMHARMERKVRCVRAARHRSLNRRISPIMNSLEKELQEEKKTGAEMTMSVSKKIFYCAVTSCGQPHRLPCKTMIMNNGAAHAHRPGPATAAHARSIVYSLGLSNPSSSVYLATRWTRWKGRTVLHPAIQQWNKRQRKVVVLFIHTSTSYLFATMSFKVGR